MFSFSSFIAPREAPNTVRSAYASHTTHGSPSSPEHPAQESRPAQGVSEVALVRVALLGDLAQILGEVAEHQRERLEQEKLANAHRAALVEAQKATAAHQAALVEQQKVLAASAIRSELRAYNNMSSLWKPLPLMSGEPLPADIEFPHCIWSLRQMIEEDVWRLASAYEIGHCESDVETLRDNLCMFLAGRRVSGN